MTNGIGVIVLLSLFATATAVSGAPHELEPGVLVNDGGTAIAVQLGDSAPEVADWNNDGLPDLLVGQFYGGKIQLFINQGTTTNFVFNGYSFVQDRGADLLTAYG